MEDKLKSDYLLNDLIPFYGTIDYSERNREALLTSRKTSVKDTALFIYNLPWVSAISFGVKEILERF